MFQKEVVIDCRGHLVGRLASIVAKEILSGQRVVCVRCEELNICGSMMRNKVRFAAFMRKHMNTNPSKYFYHFRAPSKIFYRAVRGMVPHKTPRGGMALARLRVFEGIPAPFDKVKRMVVPQALTNLRLRPDRKFIRLGDLSSQFGWKYDAVIKKLEDKRKTRALEYYKSKKAAAAKN
ncbi:hypothetical protein WA158_003658 [Blastocystis sp. Blastoise]